MWFTVLKSVSQMQNTTNGSLTASELDIRVSDRVRRLDISELLPHLTLVAEGQFKEVTDTADYANRYYQWLACLMDEVKPKQVVELGAASGISTAIMASRLDDDAKLFSVDVDPNIAWKWMNREYPQVTKILGDDLDLSIWQYAVTPPAKFNPDLLLSNTDVWFIDSLHTYDQLSKELKLYSPFFKKGAIVVLDDIRMEELLPIWESLPYDKFENTIPNHHTGFGFFIV